MNRTKRVSLIILPILVLLAFVAAGAAWHLGDADLEDEAVTEESLPPEFTGAFALTDQFGMRRTEEDFRGKYMLVFFGYTYCPDICPTALAVAAEALDKIGSVANRIVPIFVTVDPRRDTADRLKSYLASFDAKPPAYRLNFVGLTGTNEEIAKAAEGYNVIYFAHLNGEVEDGSGYSVDHTADTYLISPEGKFVAYYSIGILSDELAADLMQRIH